MFAEDMSAFFGDALTATLAAPNFTQSTVKAFFDTESMGEDFVGQEKTLYFHSSQVTSDTYDVMKTNAVVIGSTNYKAVEILPEIDEDHTGTFYTIVLGDY